MASPCEVLIETESEILAEQLGRAVAHEVWRIEDKYSRYSSVSACSKINRSQGKPVVIDQETFLLLNFAEQCYKLSGGVFDITSGVLRNAWRFDGSDNVPTNKQVKSCLAHIGWEKVSYDQYQITLAKGMELDFGGIGKEYAVDKAIIIAKSLTKLPVLVNLGGDLSATSPRKNNQAWQVGIDHPGLVKKHSNDKLNSSADNSSVKKVIVSLSQGALATSGDANRFLLKDGKRYSHILNAQTGWPIENAPYSMTVVAPQCIQAGILATLALMKGGDAEKFLMEQDVKHWAIR
ncbi:MAG: FAD:protein FMN transferase [Colwellia sp.]|nr:FAD:protein FMN transferase [Colwellia sp.]